MEDFIFTDLAYEKRMSSERSDNQKIEKNEKNDKKEYLSGAIRVLRSFTKEGCYITVFTPKLWQLSDVEFSVLATCLAKELKEMMHLVLEERKYDEELSVMIVGLGNEELTADALGPETARRITVTRHLYEMIKSSNSPKNHYSVSAITPNVVGNTGIETLELIRGAVSNVKPALLIVVDSLAAKSSERLACTVQISDQGICPGSGIGNIRKEISRKTLGIPVIAIGVPMVVHSSTMVCSVLEKSGMTRLEDKLRAVLEKEREKGGFIMPKESDLIIKSVSFLLATAIDRACAVEKLSDE